MNAPEFPLDIAVRAHTVPKGPKQKAHLSHKGRAQPYPLIRYSSADKETQP